MHFVNARMGVTHYPPPVANIPSTRMLRQKPRVSKRPEIARAQQRDRRDRDEENMRDDGISAVRETIEKGRTRGFPHSEPVKGNAGPPRLRVPRAPEKVASARSFTLIFRQSHRFFESGI